MIQSLPSGSSQTASNHLTTDNENDGRLARERLTLIRIFEDLRALGYGGSYAAVRRYAIAWREKRASPTADAYVPLSFAPGEAY